MSVLREIVEARPAVAWIGEHWLPDHWDQCAFAVGPPDASSTEIVEYRVVWRRRGIVKLRRCL